MLGINELPGASAICDETLLRQLIRRVSTVGIKSIECAIIDRGFEQGW